MYERNAIVLERYFNQMFGYNMKNNIKTNFKDYCDLVECLEKYSDISEEEESIIQEYDSIANKIQEIQRKQEILNKRNLKNQEERENLFNNIDDDSETIQKKFNNINSNIDALNDQIKENSIEFIRVVAEFNEKSKNRSTSGRSRRNIEVEYNQRLNKILDNYKEIDVECERRAKQFLDLPTEDIEEELKNKIMKNGEKEKIPFNMEVISKAITLSVDIQKRETEILANIYEKSNKLFAEIKNNMAKGERHKKIIKDSKCKLEFVGALKDYLVLFLDNERLTAVNGKEEHDKLMEEACKNLDEDLVQINNLYTLLLKEITKKIAKKSYTELFNMQYLKDLERKSEEFDAEIKKLKLPVTIINPNYWRIEGMKKIYDVFCRCVTEEYGRDLTEYMPVELPEKSLDENEDFEDDDWDFEEQKEAKKEPKKEQEAPKAKHNIKLNLKKPKKSEESKEEIDKKIDMILGFNDNAKTNKELLENDEDEDIEDEKPEDSEDVFYDIWGNDIKDGERTKKEKAFYEDIEDDPEDDFEDDDDEGYEWDDEDDDGVNIFDDDDDWDDDLEDDDNEDDGDDDDEEYEEDENNGKNRYDDESDEETDDDDDWDDDWDDEEIEEEPPKKKTAKGKKDDWGDEFIKVDKKDKTKKKKGFLDKFKK